MRVGIIGAGLIGKKRASALLPTDILVAVADTDKKRAEALASEFNCKAFSQWEEIIHSSEIEAVIVSTTNNAIPSIACAALGAGKHVLVEKPGGRNPQDLAQIVEKSKSSNVALRVGFNHRFHPALQSLKKWLETNEQGPILYFRGRYGHGGRVGYDREWRANAEICGGGELLDQGVHLIDLCRWLGGEFDLKWGHTQTYFWDMPVEDNGFLFLQSPDGKKSAWLHASCTEWKNLFHLEVFCRQAKFEVTGIGRSYGLEELKIYKMKPEMGPPEIFVESFPGEDISWVEEWKAFLRETKGSPSSIATIQDAEKAVQIVHASYAMSAN